MDNARNKRGNDELWYRVMDHKFASKVINKLHVEKVINKWISKINYFRVIQHIL